MGRAALYPEDAILDGAKRVVARAGVRGATVAAIAEEVGAPTGSIYHRFGSVDELLARSWTRAVKRFQAAVIPETSDLDPLEAAVACSLSVYDFCVADPEEALLLRCFRAQDFRRTEFSGELAAELDHLNQPVAEPLRRLARAMFGDGRSASVDLLLMAIVDLPYGAARAGAPLQPERRRRLEAAVRAALA